MEWKKLIDKALGTDFDAPVYDKTVGRKKLVRQIDLAAKQHTDGITRAPNRAWKSGGKEGNPAIRFAAKVDGKTVLLDGDETVFIPASRFQDFLAHLKKSVEAGDLDKEIRAALESDGAANETKPSTSGGSTRAFTPEGRVNIAMNNRYNKSLSDSLLQAKLIAGGHDADVVKTAIATRKKS